MSENVTKMFGRTYNEVGNTNSDFIIKTRGQIKVQYGHKFIDLIKNGKLNTEDSSVFKEVELYEDIQPNGIYLYEGSIYVCIEDSIVKLSDGEDSTYVSYINQQTTSPEQKFLAQNNIGLVFNSLEDAHNIIVDGFIYCINDKSFYMVSGGSFTKQEFEIPNPYPKQFVIEKDSNTIGALKLVGDKKQNGIALGEQTYIYESSENTIIENSYNKIIIVNQNKNIITIGSTGVTSLVNISTKGDFIGDSIYSEDFQEGLYGYRLYNDPNSGKSILEVDRIIERDTPSKLNSNIRTYSEGAIAINVTGGDEEFEEESSEEESSEDPDDFDEENEFPDFPDISKIIFKCSPQLDTLQVGDILELQPFLNTIRYRIEESDGEEDEEEDEEIDDGDIDDTIEEEETPEIIEVRVPKKVAILLYVESVTDNIITTRPYPNNITYNINNGHYIVNSRDFGEIEVLPNETPNNEDPVDLYPSLEGAQFYKIAQQGNPEDSSTWYKTFCIDYLNNSISLQQNYVNYNGELIIYKHSVIGNIEEYLEEPKRTWEQGLYSDQPIFNGATFKPLSEDIKIQDYPKYSEKLNKDLCNNHIKIEDGDDFEKVIPTIGWIKQNVLKEPLKSINESKLPDTPEEDNSYIVYKNEKWDYQKVEPKIPIGSIVMWYTDVIPEGWLLCDGSTFDINKYLDLYTVLGNDFLPDLNNSILEENSEFNLIKFIIKAI